MKMATSGSLKASKAANPLPAALLALAGLEEAPLRQHARGGLNLGVRHTADKHGADGEDLLGIGVGADVAKAHTGQAAEGKVEGGDVGAAHRRPSHCAVDVGRLQTFAQLMEPPLEEKPARE